MAKQLRWSVVAIALGCALTIGSNSAKLMAEPPGPSDSSSDRAILAGQIQSEKGIPLRGVTVLIHEGTPRLPRNGLSPPHCYPDCLKTAVTDEGGRFSIPDVDKTLVYKLLVAREGFESKYLTEVDSRTPDLQVTLTRPKSEGTADVRGRILDAHGQPIAGAEIIPRGYMKGNAGMTGPMEKYAPVVASNSDGYFWIYTLQPVDSLELEIRARGFVTRKFNSVRAGSKNLQDLSLRVGVTIRGRVVKDSQPVTGAIMGTVFTERTTSDFSGPWETVTDSAGRFELSHVAGERAVYIYGKMSSLKSIGGVEAIKLKTGVSGTTHDLGDVPVSAGHKLTGHIELGEVKKPREGLVLTLSRSGMPDAQSVTFDYNGHFEFSDVPTGRYVLNVLPSRKTSTPSFHLSSKNRSVHPAYLNWLEGIIDADRSITVALEAGVPSEPRMPDREPAVSQLKAAVDAVLHSPLEGISKQKNERPSDR